MIERCRRQLIISPSGYAAGVDLGTALTLAGLAGYDTTIMGALLPAAADGLVTGLNREIEQNRDE